MCLKTVLEQCYTDITIPEEEVLFRHAPEVIQHIRTEGCVTDQFLDSLGIPKLPNGRHIDRDGLVPWRRHAYMMSHTYSKLNFIDYLQIRNDNNNPILQQRKKEREQALRVVNRAAAVKQKEVLAASDKLMKVAARAAEKGRRQSLTVAERKFEDQQKRALVASAKTARAHAAELELAQAVLLLEV